MKLAGFELRNFRSIGSESVVLVPWHRLNILVGQNNCGKSNVLRAIQKISTSLRTNVRQANSREGNTRLTHLDSHKRRSDNRFLFRLCFEFEHDEPEDNKAQKLTGLSSVDFDLSWSHEQAAPQVTDFSLAHIEDFRRANDVLQYYTNRHWTQPVGKDEIRKEFLSYARNILGDRFVQLVPPVKIIPEFRKVTTELVALLGGYQHPVIGSDQDQHKFLQIEEFVQRLLHLPRARLEVAHDNSDIILVNDGLRLPLSCYGTGVAELVILLLEVLSIEDGLCCIEEPEIHLHPRLQREFIEFILTETTNQYLISTHSPTFINAVSQYAAVQVFHLRLENQATVGGPVLREADTLRALHDLGLRAGDVLQSNCIVWVEGPSDRIYLNRWIELLDQSLVEGQDYSVMFYGGRLLSHLCANRDKVPEELIPVLRINQNAVVLMDSDKETDCDTISATKLRVREECESSGNVCWITHGREIENYLPERVVALVSEKMLGQSIGVAIGPYQKFDVVLDEALESVGMTTLNYSSSKVKYAREFAEHFELADMCDELRHQVEELISRIKQWNA